MRQIFSFIILIISSFLSLFLSIPYTPVATFLALKIWADKFLELS